LGWAENLGDADLPHLTHAALQKVPWMVAGMGSLLGGIYWVINRRMKLAARAAEEVRIEARVEEVMALDPRGEVSEPVEDPTAGGQSDE
ncbi:MAG: hypothetical protein ABIF09_06805, partial [Gemmatimonadota bacterium]